jgi:CHAD domain-containing protein
MSESEQAVIPSAQEAEPESEPTPTDDGPVQTRVGPRDLEGILRAQFQTLREQHSTVLTSEDATAIHKMRVTTRRLQASLDLLERPDDRLGVRGLKKTLRRTRRMLSQVRNYDVFLELLEKDAASGRRSIREPYGLVATALRPRRQRRMEKAKRHLSRLDVEKIAGRLGLQGIIAVMIDPGVEEPVLDPGQNGQVSDQVAAGKAGIIFDAPWIALHAADRLDQRLAEFHLRASEAHPTTDPAELHQLRIAAKRVRYLFEIVSQMGHGDARQSLTWLRSLQDRIGEWHDLEALQDEIASIVARPLYLKQNLIEGRILLEAAIHLQKKKTLLVARLFPVRVPRTLILTGARLSRSLRRSAQGAAPARRVSRPRARPIEVIESKS